MTIFTSCNRQENEINSMCVSELEKTSVSERVSLNEAEDDLSSYSSDIKSMNCFENEYIYRLPIECQALEWEYENALCHIEFVNIMFEPDEDYSEESFDYSVPYSIYSDLKHSLISFLNGTLSYDGAFDEYVYFSNLEYGLFDLNDDGITDYLTRAYIDIKEGYSGGGGGQYVSKIFLAQPDGSFTAVNCSLDNSVSIMQTKSYGLYDILCGYTGNEVCQFDGCNSYTIPYKSDKLFLNSTIDKERNTICLSYQFDGNIQTGFDEYYVVVYVDDPRVKKNILCSCDEYGTPIKYTGNLLFGDGFDFYAEVNEELVNEFNFIMFKQLKFVPVSNLG